MSQLTTITWAEFLMHVLILVVSPGTWECRDLTCGILEKTGAAGLRTCDDPNAWACQGGCLP
jgi:hypothetical protein